ncbi:carbohydrate kinase family protein [Candidatus Halocynthiibacter alkanivorans]|uniref:carbohydrate kinase family protein n=1 Tax=Candidatus Halocynthiibacter alkanivorans TaxID=2267619 RepID=UPI000DF26492|nr:carbohydrate kinase [Candidatus Halocynthiibacter alkanivorans]
MLLCCGEALIDMIPAPTVTGSAGYVPHCGGAVFNTAIALGRLGVRTGMLTGLSTDLFGQKLTAALEASHVEATHVIHSERPTTLAFVTLIDGHATYAFFDENSAGRMLRPSDIPALPADVTALYLGGISLTCEPCADAYASLASREAAGRVIMLDPNIRPDFIRDTDRYRDRLDGMIAQADIVKVSDEDLNWIHPGPEPLPDKLAMLRAAGPSVVILTCGADGSTAFLAGAEVSVAVERVEVVDTVGAGDTFNAGVLARLSEMGLLTKEALAQISPDDMRAALAFGARVAAVTVSRAGPNPPWSHEVRSRREQGVK